jgi:hypothetical protein
MPAHDLEVQTAPGAVVRLTDPSFAEASGL